jgi:hypothetical protein
MVKWQLASSLDRDYIFDLAKSKGWYDSPPKVQVKAIKGMTAGEVWYVLEPFEENCVCPDVIHPPKLYIKD